MSSINYDSSSDNMPENNLIINYLPQTLTDNEFKKIFERIGPVSSARIIRNKTSTYSYGFGFVSYFRKEDADRAIVELNGMELKNKRIKVAFSRKHCDDIKKAKLYIKNIPDIGVEKLNKIFSNYGTIIQSNIATNKGIAFILYDRREQAEKAIEAMQNAILVPDSLPIKIKFATANNNNNNNNNNQMRPYNNYNNNNYNTNRQYNQNNNYQNRPMNKNYSNSYQGDYQNDSANYQNYDDNYNSNFNPNSYKGRNNFQQYSNKSHHSNRYNPMNKNYNQNNNYQQQQQYSNYNNQRNNYQEQGGNTIFVYNIGNNTEEQLFNMFSKFGPVIKSNVLRKKNLAFIEMRSYEESVNAIENLNNYVLNGSKLQVSFKK